MITWRCDASFAETAIQYMQEPKLMWCFGVQVFVCIACQDLRSKDPFFIQNLVKSLLRSTTVVSTSTRTLAGSQPELW